MSAVTVWVGGGTGAGKTTVTRLLAGRHGLRVFQLDAFWYKHAIALSEPEPSPDEQWLGLTPAEQAEEFEAFARRRLVADNVRTWLTTRHVPSTAPTTYPFACECGTSGCHAMVDLPLARVDTVPIIAPEH
jgi:cytidylate kinase